MKFRGYEIRMMKGKPLKGGFRVDRLPSAYVIYAFGRAVVFSWTWVGLKV
jgi:hypothetical protein